MNLKYIRYNHLPLLSHYHIFANLSSKNAFLVKNHYGVIYRQHRSVKFPVFFQILMPTPSQITIVNRSSACLGNAEIDHGAVRHPRVIECGQLFCNLERPLPSRRMSPRGASRGRWRCGRCRDRGSSAVSSLNLRCALGSSDNGPCRMQMVT